MNIDLNREQSKGLASFFFDIAKGLVLGGIGFATVVPLQTKFIFSFIAGLFALWCVRFALFLLAE